MKNVAVAILTWNGKHFLEKFLPSVVSNSTGQGITVYVIDNASTDGSVSFLKDNHPEVRIIQLDKNHGFAGGYNRGLQEIHADYYLLLNSDVEVTPGWIPPLLEAFDNDENLVACMPKIKSWYQKDSFEYAGAAGGFIDKYGYTFCRGRIFGDVEKDSGQYDNTIQVFWTTGACMMIKSNVFHEFGGFDEYFFAHMEEIDLCWRMKNKNHKLCYVHESVVYHLGGGTLPQNNPRKTFLNYRNNLLLLYKNLPSDQLYKVLLIRLLLDYLSALYYLQNADFKSIMAIAQAHSAFFKALKHYKKLRNKTHSPASSLRHQEMFDRSLVFSYFIRKRKKFSDLKWASFNPHEQ